ncbi:MAG TPA: PQQ-binding-like beta-propeller repeat protein [Bryobacteraceae bacterium]|jgi:alcohol dehydrogenase (cytochrome c)|nr:PQQ-binding-like beta-propeller repeat protein [Bryobacteraceae bacterium]
MRLHQLLSFALIAAGLPAQITYDSILHASDQPQNWMTYGGNYSSTRYSILTQLNHNNAKDLKLKWVWRPRYLEKMEATPLVVNGILYTVQNSEAVAMDASTGRIFWTFHYAVPPESNQYVMVVKGLAMSGNSLFWATYDGHLISIDAKTGTANWNKVLVDWHKGYQLNVAPLVVKDKVVLGPATNEEGANCWVAAYDVKTGNEVWRFYTAPMSADDPASKTWAGESWKHGGSPIWVTGSYDPESNTTFWGTGNPNAGWNGDNRAGDDLYSDSVIALDADTGKLKWHYQFTPHDEFDWDSVQVPVLATIAWHGAPRKVMLWANRNGFFYVLDRSTGKFLLGKAFVKQNWNVGFDEAGRPMRSPALDPKPVGGPYVEPGTQGGTNWYSPSFSPRTGLFYVSTWNNYGGPSGKGPIQEWTPGGKYSGGAVRPPGARRGSAMRGAGIAYRTEAEGYGAVSAIDPQTGEKKWEFKMVDYTESGVLTTASDLLFSGGKEGNFFALNDRSGELLWKTNLGGTIAGGPITYQANGHQYVAVCADNALYAFGLPD